MSDHPRLTFKLASDPWELEEIHRLNYRTFVEEIPQHPPNPDRRLVDRFHAENTYVVCIAEQDDGTRQLAGMVALRSKRPFSLDQKVSDLDRYLPKDLTVGEVRLLAVDKNYRKTPVAVGLIRYVSRHAHGLGIEYGVISATTRELKLYQRLGFEPFGPVVGTGDALFQPMGMSIATLIDTPNAVSLGWGPSAIGDQVNFLPGPVTVALEVRAAFERPPTSTRSSEFMQRFQETRERLRRFVRAREVEILLGSGTLANDVVAGQLSVWGEPGLVLSNGEFGERILDQATRAQLGFDALQLEWGAAFDEEKLGRFARSHPRARWLWATHCETSTGVLNDLPMLERVARRSNLELCLDCISSIGLVPVDLSGVLLASGVSGKGLGGYPGLSMVFHREPVAPAPGRLPRYLDLGTWSAADGVPFTHSSNLIEALGVACERSMPPERFQERAQLSAWLRSKLLELGFTLIGDERHLAPGVLTIALPPSEPSRRLGMRLEREGYLLSYRSSYLLHRNWIQICLMGEVRKVDLEALLEVLEKKCTFLARGRIASNPAARA